MIAAILLGSGIISLYCVILGILIQRVLEGGKNKRK